MVHKLVLEKNNHYTAGNVCQKYIIYADNVDYASDFDPKNVPYEHHFISYKFEASVVDKVPQIGLHTETVHLKYPADIKYYVRELELKRSEKQEQEMVRIIQEAQKRWNGVR